MVKGFVPAHVAADGGGMVDVTDREAQCLRNDNEKQNGGVAFNWFLPDESTIFPYQFLIT